MLTSYLGDPDGIALCASLRMTTSCYRISTYSGGPDATTACGWAQDDNVFEFANNVFTRLFTIHYSIFALNFAIFWDC